jgi:hypothetical protein
MRMFNGFIVSRTRRTRRTPTLCGACCVSAAFLVMGLLASCGGAQPPSVQAAAPSAAAPALDRCALLKDDEVREAIGAHGAGVSDVGNEWGLQSCRWTATTAQKISGADWFDAIEVAVFEPDRESWAREQAKGEPVDDLIRGARYDSSYGELWFDCPGRHFCVVKARLASDAHRKETARRIAQSVLNRLR